MAGGLQRSGHDAGSSICGATLRRSPGLTIVAALSLSLRIAANPALFSVVNSLILRRLPVRNPEQIVSTAAAGHSYSLYQKLRGLNTVFSGVAATCLLDRSADLPGGDVRVELVSGSYFALLGID